MQDEMQSLEKNCMWDVVPLPKGKKHVHRKWIYKRKEGLSPSEPPKYKGRLVAKGFIRFLVLIIMMCSLQLLSTVRYALSLVLLLHMILSSSS
jgi:hypothetical protein